ncbi:MAG: efflux RND transporter periplasmic adaptor subunit [Acidobacteria bacterium]|nr:efflux RND transporter periplasmic adaptor subunit [Acidobacteriota bacterium]
MSEKEQAETGLEKNYKSSEEPDAQADSLARKRRLRRWISAGGVLVVAAIVALVVLGSGAGDANGAESAEETAEEKAPVPVEVTEAVAGTVAAYISATANLVAEKDVSVLSEVEGRVTSLSVDEGDSVRRGQVLARLDPSDEQIALKKAQLRSANAELAFERSRDLMAKELISREENDRLTVDYQIAGQELAEADWALAQTVIKSPFDGRVTLREIQLGQHVRPGDKLFQITDFEPLIARIYLSESDIVGLGVGTPVRIQLNANPQTSLSGRIRQISPIVDTATGTVKVTVEAVSPPPEIRPGSFVSIHVVRETHHDVILVPREAVLRELQSSHVFVADGEAAAKRTVTLGIEDSGRVEVLDGLELGDRVIVAGQGGLREGTRVRILGEEPEEDAESDAETSSDAEAS